MQFTLVQFTLFLFLYLQTAAADISGNIVMWDKDYAILERELIMVLLCLLARCFFFPGSSIYYVVILGSFFSCHSQAFTVLLALVVLLVQIFILIDIQFDIDIYWLKKNLISADILCFVFSLLDTQNINRVPSHLLCVVIYESLLRYYDSQLCSTPLASAGLLFVAFQTRVALEDECPLWCATKTTLIMCWMVFLSSLFIYLPFKK